MSLHCQLSLQFVTPDNPRLSWLRLAFTTEIWICIFISPLTHKNINKQSNNTTSVGGPVLDSSHSSIFSYVVNHKGLTDGYWLSYGSQGRHVLTPITLKLLSPISTLEFSSFQSINSQRQPSSWPSLLFRNTTRVRILESCRAKTIAFYLK